MRGPNGKVGLKASRPAPRGRPLVGVGGAGSRTLGGAYSDLIVPFGRMVVTAAFCTVTSVPLAISTPM